jgi:hypothetical protein
MRPHPRIRRTLKWTAAAVTLLLAVLWIRSGWRSIDWNVGDGRGVFLSRGVFGISIFGPPTRDGVTTTVSTVTGWLSYPHPFKLRLWYFYDRTGNLHSYMTPVWVPTALMLLSTAALWRKDTLARRRARLDCCPKCNYDRTGIAAGTVCPECGAPAA